MHHIHGNSCSDGSKTCTFSRFHLLVTVSELSGNYLLLLFVVNADMSWRNCPNSPKFYLSSTNKNTITGTEETFTLTERPGNEFE